MEKEEFYNKIEEITQNTNFGVSLTQKIKTKIKSWKIFGGKLQPNYINTPKELVEKLKEPIEQYINAKVQQYETKISELETKLTKARKKEESVKKMLMGILGICSSEELEDEAYEREEISIR